MKKVLIISSSPRKGSNSELLCHAFEEGALSAGHSVEFVTLRQTKVLPCIACDSCRTTGVCAQKDEGDALLDQMEAADLIALATPVYFYSMAAQLKALIDRCVTRYTKLKNKEFVFLLSAADTDQTPMDDYVIPSLRGFTYCLDGAVERGIIYGLGAWERESIIGNPAMQQAHQLGASL